MMKIISKIKLQSNINGSNKKNESYNNLVYKRVEIISIETNKNHFTNRVNSGRYPFNIYNLAEDTICFCNAAVFLLNFKELFRELLHKLDNKLMVIDIKHCNLLLFLDLFTEEELKNIIVSKVRYKSTNGSIMHLITINYKNIKK
jgi:hypothetical protein